MGAVEARLWARPNIGRASARDLIGPIVVVAIGLLILVSGWLVGARSQGLLESPRLVTSPAFAAALLCFAAVLTRPRWIGASDVVLAAGVMSVALTYAGALGTFNTGSVDPAFEAGKAAVITLLPLPLLVLIRTSRAAFAVLAVVYSFEAAFAYGQLSQLTFEGSGTNWLTVGEPVRWWDSRAVFGTFSTTGKSAFGNAVAIFAVVFFSLSLMLAPSRTRAVARVLFLSAGPLIVLSLGRAALASTVIGTLLVVATVRTRQAFIAAVVLWAGVAVLSGALVAAKHELTLDAMTRVKAPVPVGSQSSDSNAPTQRDELDPSIQLRLAILSELAAHADASWLVGVGYGGASAETLKLGLSDHTGQPGRAAAVENLFVRTLIEGGVVGLTSLMLALALLFRGRSPLPRRGDADAWRVGLRAVVAALLVQLLATDLLIYAQSAAVFWFVTGTVAAGRSGSADYDGANDDHSRASPPTATRSRPEAIDSKTGHSSQPREPSSTRM